MSRTHECARCTQECVRHGFCRYIQWLGDLRCRLTPKRLSTRNEGAIKKPLRRISWNGCDWTSTLRFQDVDWQQIERASHPDIERGIPGLARRFHQIGTGHGAELRPNEDGSALLCARPRAFQIAPLRANEISRPRSNGGERDLVFLVRLLHAGGLEISRIIRTNPCSSSPCAFDLSIGSSFSSTASTRCGESLSTVNGPATRTLRLSS